MLSGGAQQRTSIGRALVRDPELILFDEPLSHLDADQKIHLRTEIKRLQKLGAITSILVTHDQTEATAMADRIAVMHQGVLQQVATPHELYERPANMFVANFIGEPPMNLLPLAAHDGRLVLAGAGWPLPLDDRRMQAGAERGRGRDRRHSTRARLGQRGACRGFRRDRQILRAARRRRCRRGGAVRASRRRRSSPRSRDRAGYRAEDLVGIEFAADHIYLFAAADGRNLEVRS